MSEIYNEDDDFEDDYEYEEHDDASDDEEVEEITSDDVDAVVAKLTTMNEGIELENIRVVIENAIDEILHLVYTDDELVGEDETDDFLEEAA